MKSIKLPLYLLAFGLVLSACTPADDADDATPADTAGMAAPAPAPAAPSPEPVEVELDEVEDSNISGKATATHSATDVTVAIVLEEGGNTETSYPAHIHTGTCEAGGPVAVELSPVTNLQSTKTVPLSSLPANQNSFVQVHDPSGKAIACGDLPGHGDDADNTTTTTTPPATTTH
jgi:hypothetical protein